MKKRSSSAYLVIGSIYNGFDESILRVFAEVAEYYEAQVIHLGKLVDDKTVAAFQRVKWGLGTQIKSKDARKAREAARELLSLQDEAIDALKDNFGKVTLVMNDRQIMEDLTDDDVEVVKDYMNLGRHLLLSSVQAGGDKVSSMPMTKRAKAFFKRLGHSCIAPHPIPAVDSSPREGLNQAHNYFTTGSLKNIENPKAPAAFFQCSHLPSAVLVLVDEDNDEFHPCQLHIDYIRGETSHRIDPAVIHDGLVFSADGVEEVSSDDKAMHETDGHSPWEHMGVLGSTRALNELHQPSVFFNGGDAANFDSVCPHTEGRPRERENFRLVKELKALRRFLTAQTNNVKSIKRRVLVDSNHHAWVTQAVSKHPNTLEGVFDWKTLGETTFQDWEVMLRDVGGAAQVCRFGDLAIRHGDQESGPEEGEDLYYKYLGGHYHRYRSYKRGTSARPGCKLGPKYLQGRETAWQNQVTTITKFKGKTSVAPKIILHDENRKKSRFSFRNEIYEVDFYQYGPN